MYIHVHVFTINDLVVKAVVFIPTLLDVISLKTFCRWITWRLQSCCFSDWHLLLHVYEYNWRIRSYHTNFVHVKLFLLYLVILMWFETVKLLSYPISCILTTKQFATKSIIMIINNISFITEELLPFKCFFQSHGLSCRCSSRCNGKAWKRNC